MPTPTEPNCATRTPLSREAMIAMGERIGRELLRDDISRERRLLLRQRFVELVAALAAMQAGKP